MAGNSARIPILYIAPWVDYGGTDKGTIDWFRWIDRERFAPSIVTTQPSPNRRLGELVPFAEEIWPLPDLMTAERMPGLIFDFIQSRGIRVVHVMNSRLGFDLLPDLSCLPNPPSVVVQLHVEESDRSGYVRYVTTRYGNLVDGFSVTSEHLADAVCDYGIPGERIHVIYTGVDADEEFSPEATEPVPGLAADRMQILYPARLVEQKDPLLMAEVAAALRSEGVGFEIHVIGEGHLEEALRNRIAELGLRDHVELHPPTPELNRWYAACDAVLLTSVYEGVPYVVFEAMAMGVPVVAPAIPGNVELLGAGDPGLIEPRNSVEGYASALAQLAADGELAWSRGRDLRKHALARFSLARMAADHCELYERLISGLAPREPERVAAGDGRPKPIRFINRALIGQPLVSVLVPHFNQGRFLGECIESVRGQTYPEIELVVVDDASTEAAATSALEELDSADDVALIRLDENSGPARARNVGLDRCRGRYILPLDADNLLLPNAVENLVEQLQTAGEEVGFIYPNLQYFGNREDYYEVPEYNVFTLLHGNFCDTCSLVDREVFDAGFRYSEDIRLGHEDWDFTLRLAERGIRGEAARGPTVRYRKWGFNRSDEVEHAPRRFQQLLAETSALHGLEAEIKSVEAPALSLIPLQPIEGEAGIRAMLAEDLAGQWCIDFEVIAHYDGAWPREAEVPQVRRIPASLATTELDAARHGLSVSKGYFAALTSADLRDLLADPGFVDKVLRRFTRPDQDVAEREDPDVIVLADAGDDGRYPLRPLGHDEAPDALPHTVLWRRSAELELPRGLHADAGDPVGSLVRQLSGAGTRVEWRHLRAFRAARRPESRGELTPLPRDPKNDEDPGDIRPAARPMLPGKGEYRVPRWEDTPSWIPPLSTIAIRYRERDGERRIVTTGVRPDGFVPDYHLGALRVSSLEGTTWIARVGDDYRSIPRGERLAAPADAEDLGYAEIAALPQLDPLVLAVHRATGQRLLVSPPDDPLMSQVDVIETLGFVDPFPPRPRRVPEADRSWGLLGLTRAVDYRAQRHRYAIGSLPEGDFYGELGGLAESGFQGSVPAWIVDGRLVTDRHRPPGWRSGVLAAGRWVAETAAWRGTVSRSRSARVALRRMASAPRYMIAPAVRTPTPEGEPDGWLFDQPRSGRAPLYTAYHPVTGDQLLTRSLGQIQALGFERPELLGYVRRSAPLTGELEPRALSIPWAKRRGMLPGAW